MNTSIRKVAIALAVLLLALFVNLNYVQVVKGSNYRDDPNNRRVLLNEYASARGPIVVQGQDIAKSVATSDELKYLREYPSKDAAAYAAVTGWYSYIYGSRGIEDAEDSILSGNDTRLFGSRLADILTGRNPRGGSVDLTIDKAAQEAAYNALVQKGKTTPRAAVVATDPSTGAILAAVSTPSFDPNALSSHNAQKINHAYACYNDIAYPIRGASESGADYTARTKHSIDVQLALRQGGTTLLAAKHAQDAAAYPLAGYVYSTDSAGNEQRSLQSFADTQFPSFGKSGCGDVPEDPTQMFLDNPSVAGPLHNRAFTERYPPGSTFKTIVAAAALKYGLATPDSVEQSPRSYYPDTGQADPKNTCKANSSQDCLENFDGEECVPGKAFATLTFAFAKSCNTTFAMLAVDKVKGERLKAEAQLFGFDPSAQLTTPLPVVASTIGSGNDLVAPGLLARTAFGQQDVAMTPMQGVMIAEAVANSGLMMKPYLVAKEVGPDLKTIDEPKPQQLAQVLDPGQAQDLQAMMDEVVNGAEGTGSAARVSGFPNVTVYGKTGTADNGPQGHLNKPHAWFIGWASENGTPKIAVSVIIENAGTTHDAEVTGGKEAGPVAAAVMAAYLKDQGNN